MVGKENNNQKDALNLLIYQYLINNNKNETASRFKVEAGITEIPPNSQLDQLFTLYNQFVETIEVRSGTRIETDSLKRIESIMMKLENEKARFARLRAVSSFSSPINRPPMDMRTAQSSYSSTDPYNFSSSPIQPLNSNIQMPSMPIMPKSPNILTEIKRVDLGVNSIFFSVFCPQNNILICIGANFVVYFYNLKSNEIEYEFELPQRQFKNMKIREVGHTIYIAYSSDNHIIRLCKYDELNKDDIKVFEFETPLKSFCLGNDTLYVLSETRIKTYTFLGVCTATSRPIQANSIDCLGNRVILTDVTRIYEYDLRLDSEGNTLIKGDRFPSFKVKNNEGFLILSDCIKVVDGQLGSCITSVKCTLPSKDVCLYDGTVAVCTTTDLFFASDVIPLKNIVEICSFGFGNGKGLLAVTADGLIILFKKMKIIENN